jgi:endogenous inhibitor of DNA gyrase (YacG/DUF329 family)
MAAAGSAGGRRRGLGEMGRSMSIVMIKCPQTGNAVSTGIEIEPDSFNSLPDISAHMRCSACGDQHIWSKGEAWLTYCSTDYRKRQS